jgi:hypothetical protein
VSDIGTKNKKNSLDALVRDAKDIVRKAHEHAQVCESFRRTLEDTKAND